MMPAKKIFAPDMIATLVNRFNMDRTIRSSSNNRINNTILTNVPRDNIDLYIVKPVGRKCYLWFTYVDKQFVAVIKYPNDNDNDFFVADIGFNNTLSYNNVLLYGYYLKIEGSDFFLIDNVINYNDYNYIIHDKSSPIVSMFKIYNKILENVNVNTNVNTNICVKNHMQIFLPFISDDYDKVFSSIYNLAYRPYGITVWSKNKNLGIHIFNNNTNVHEAVFRVEANYNHDTYDLYCQNGNKVEFYNRSLITDYRLSIYMNSLFRNIVENRDLDLLEESEDEESFENIDEYRYVDLKKTLYFKCQYNRRFKKWVPQTLIENGKTSDLITRKQLFYIEKK